MMRNGPVLGPSWALVGAQSSKRAACGQPPRGPSPPHYLSEWRQSLEF